MNQNMKIISKEVDMKKWSIGKVIENRSWNNLLFSLKIRANIDAFTAGQFTKLALFFGKNFIQKPYSYVNPPASKDLEFYIVNTKSTGLSAKLSNLKDGDLIYVEKRSMGNLTLKEVPECKILWMLSTGTAVGPFLSILQSTIGLERFKKIILVHSVRYEEDLNYLSLMRNLEKRSAGRLMVRTVVSREKVKHSLYGRIPYLIKNGNLEDSTETKIHQKDSHIMICGNPEMIRDTIEILEKEKGIKRYSTDKKRNITFERYW
ncbi:Ferredoxin--NADP(+) reductase [Candidatus Riesia pediculischaeffi PTSU]|nr:Ferredoxin--NADP(+) reductase [Candidatus Riesia pediculischaeffi PTSU]